LPDTVRSDTLKRAFESAYKSRFTYLHDGARVEVVTLRIRGEIPPPRVELDDLDDSMRSEAGALCGIAHMRMGGRRLEAAVLFRDRIPLEREVKGPAVVVDDFSTLVLPPDCAMHLDRKGHARITVNQ
jgi:N-methylhydantoinase A